MVHQLMTQNDYSKYDMQQPLYQCHQTPPQQSCQLSTPNVAPLNPQEVSQIPPYLNLSNSVIPSNGMSFGKPASRADHRNSFLAGSSATGLSDPYSCYILEQIQGSYMVDSAVSKHILVTVTRRGDQKYCIVKQESYGTGEDLFIYEEGGRFTLCSGQGVVMAVMRKGINMKEFLTWYSNDGTPIVWRRKGVVAFSLVKKSPSSTTRRNSISSVYSQSSWMSTDAGTAVLMDVNRRIQLVHEWNERSNRGTTSTSGPNSQREKFLFDDEMFSLLQSHLRQNPSLKKKFLNWGVPRIPNRRVGHNEITELGRGRLWVTASLVHHTKENGKKCYNVIDEFRGAYQEVSAGVYVQPPPQPNEPGVQHRLQRSKLGFWTIEEYNTDEDVWIMCSQELPYGHWIDSKDSRKLYKVQIVPMKNILSRLKEKLVDAEDLEKNIDFLFNSCNHKKLNTKLKLRKLVHNISNLKTKIEKQRLLSFGVQVARLADEIALSGEILS